MSRWTPRRRRFRELLAAPACVHPASVFDPASARIAEHLGYEMGMYAGSLASLTVLAAPDVIALTLTEFAEQALRIGRAAELPVFADADHGYGNAINAMRTVEELEAAGIAGLSIEDTELPQPFGAGGTPRLLSLEEGVGKMRAALAGRRDPDLVIAGRTSAAQLTGVDDAIARARAYVDAGVDAVFLVGVPSRQALDAIANQIRVPILLGGGGQELSDPDYLAGRGVRFMLRGHQTFTAAVKAIHDTMKALKDGVPPGEIAAVASKELMAAVTRQDDYAAWSRDWL